MNAAVLCGIDNLQNKRIVLPVLGSKDVLVKVRACGICGSDIPRIFTQGTYHFPTIPGHEFSGDVVQLGCDVDAVFLHKRVAVIPLIPCHTCTACENGDYAQCENYDFLGSRSDGGFAEYVKVPVDNLVCVPDNVTYEQAALLEPISVAFHALSNHNVKFGDDVAVFGLGAIGIFIAQWAKVVGANHVFAIDVENRKVETAKKVGIEDAFCGSFHELKEQVMKKTNGQGCDFVFEASGASIVLNQAIQLLKRRGECGLIGRPSKSVCIEDTSYNDILRRQLTLKGTWSFEFKQYPHHAWKIGLQALEQGKIKTEPIISHRFPLSRIQDALHIMKDNAEFSNKVLIMPTLDE